MHDPEEPPDVLDVRVAEGEVVVPPVHPLAEADGTLSQRAGGALHDLAAASSELGEPVLLDLTLRVQPELTLDPDLDPEPLAVEAVLVALVEPVERLVPLEDVLQGASPGGVDPEHHPVRCHRPVDEAEPRPVAVALAKLLERSFGLPEVEDVPFQSVVIRLVRKG